ncbi:hypothetical protein E5161_00515 [Cohnella pontilimi]|uniref:Twin transmembrane helix small protein n=1 Tax=Cohnella pontilimi TaxID=2564100 RepID=A0A4U0FK59_9BACL|nr:hypothetical protein [Cohnella pontilimi]TJY43922.1 hypothetical protein E5161_00515 [Cohnella pontilimi]
MDVILLMSAVAVVGLVGLVATLWVGFSKANKEGDPNYEHKTGRKLTRLTLLYIVTMVIAIAAFVILLNR